VETRSNHIALRDEEQSLSYQDLWHAACQFAGGYRALGVQRQEPVLLMLDNHVDSVLSWVGLTFNGSMETLVNTAYRGNMLRHLVGDSGARFAVVEEKYLHRLLDDSGDLLEVVVVRTSKSADGDSPTFKRSLQLSSGPRVVSMDDIRAGRHNGPEPIDPWDLIAILYTSGTTGRSKGARIPHAHAFTTTEFTGRQGPDDTRYVVAPQFHVAGQWGGIYRAFLCASTAYIASGFHAKSFWDEVRAVGATTTQLVGTMPEFLMLQTPKTDDADNPLREAYMTPVTAAVNEFRLRFGVEVITGFGSTETGCYLIDMDDKDVRPNRCGRKHPDFEVRLVDEHDREVRAGAVGEAVVRPKLPWTTMTEWHGDSVKTVEAWRNGWLHSGDALRVDDQGVYYFVDRIDDAIRRRGENVSSLEVEIEVASHSGVREVVAIAVPSEYAEDEIKVVVILEDGAVLSESALIHYLIDRVPYFMVPRYVEFVEDLPRTSTQKVKKAELRKKGIGAAWDREAAGINVSR
jgi:crotonobetaine/carnitine-CoA ligase